MTAIAPEHRSADGLRWVGIGAILSAFAARALATSSELPGWDMDPTIVVASLGGIGPAWSFWLDVLALLGAAAALLGEAAAGRPIRYGGLALAAVGCGVVAWHGWIRPEATLGDRRIGSSWCAAMLGAVALWHVCRDERFRRVVAGVIIGLIGVLALKGAQDVLIAHPRTVREFQAQREMFFAAQGWTPESPMARAYERRLSQPEASGWFGLANVYASFAAASAVAMLVLLANSVARLRGPDPRTQWPVIAAVALGLGASVAALCLSGSKGGFLAAGAGVMAVGVLVILVRRSLRSAAPSWEGAAAMLVGLFAIVGPLLLIVTRGFVGEHLGDRSLLFRWFYLQAAARVFGEHPGAGVGPDQFQAAYLIFKNPLSPEDVRSPHSILADWGATLGVVGLLSWGALWLGWVLASARLPVLLAKPGAGEKSIEPPLRPELRAMALCAAAATLLATYIDRTHATPDVAAVRLLGLIAWCIVGCGIVAAARSRLTLSLAMAGAALTLAAHGQIDVTPSLPSSVGLFMALIAAAAAPEQEALAPEPRTTKGRPLAVAAAPGAALLALAAALALGSALPTTRWERALGDAAGHARSLAIASTLYREVQTTPDALRRQRAQSELLAELSAALGRRVEPSAAAVERAMADLELAQFGPAAKGLEEASTLEPGEWQTRREASRLHLGHASALLRAGRPQLAAAAMERATALANAEAPAGITPPPADATEHAWRALVYRTRHELAPDPALLSSAAAAYLKAAELDPYNTDVAAQLFDLYERLGDREEALRWARRALELDALSRLDAAARGLAPERRARLEAALPEP